MSIDVGARLKDIRKQKGLSQRELAKRAGVTNSTISLIEQNRVSPSVSSLKKVLDGLPMPLQEFFAVNVQEKRQVFYSADDLPDFWHGDVGLRLVGHNHPNRTLSLLIETYPKGADTGEEPFSHEGQEAGVIIQGEIELTVDGDCRVLKQGESYFFDSHLPHRFRNISDKVCEIISANNPPSI